MTKSTITREQRINEVKELIANAEEWAGYYEHPIHDKPQREMFEGMARVMAEHLAALTAMDSEPVAWRRFQETPNDGGYWILYDYRPNCSGVEPLYRHAQPAPVVPDEINSASAPEVFEIAAEAERLGLRGTYASYAVGWNACRAAMLQAEPVTTANKLGNPPAKSDFIPAQYGVAPDKGVKNMTCQKCNGTGMADSGGVQPWGEPISVPCDCAAIPESATNSPVIPDGYVMVPMRLTAENGAKGALSGEFSETKFVNCPECFGDDECETCDGSGRIEITVPVTWTTIKEIWAKGVEHFAAAPQEVK